MPLKKLEDIEEDGPEAQASNDRTGRRSAPIRAPEVKATRPFTDEEADVQSVLEEISEDQAEVFGQLYRENEELEDRLEELERRDDAQREMLAELYTAVWGLIREVGGMEWDFEHADIEPDEDAEEAAVGFEELGDPYDPTREFEVEEDQG